MVTKTRPKTAPARKAEHPMAGQTLTGAEMIIQVLADEGVDVIFGYSGGAILPTYDAIFRYNREQEKRGGDHSIRLVVPANEQGAGFMAAGYARSTGKVGVALVTSGPGATNTVTPVRDSMSDSIPIIVICGQVPRAAMGTDAFQEAPVFNIMSACAKHVFLPTNPEELEETVRTAFEIARSGRPGPVVIDVPKDVQNWSGQFKGHGYLNLRGFWARKAELERSRITREQAIAFYELLAKSQRPLIYAGGGVINSGAAQELRAFAEHFRIPVTTTLMGIGAVDTTSDLSLHMLGMHGSAYANYAVEDCDFLITVAARFDDRVAGKPAEFAPQARAIAHIDIDASEIGKVKAAQWRHVGDAKTALADLLAYGREFPKTYGAWADHCLELKRNHAFDYDRKSALIQPYEVIETLSELTHGDAIIVTGVGQHQMWAAQYYRCRHPRHWITSGCMGTMGFGLPASIGAQLANPGKLVVDIDGDGSLRMNLGELETLTTYNIPVKVLLLNNHGDGMVRQWQKLYFGERFSGTDKSLHKKDFVRAAEADGFQFARRLEDKARIRETLQEFISFEGPALLEVMIDYDACVFPMVGPGMSYKQMMTGDFIKPRAAAPEKPTAQAAETVDMTKIPDLF